MPLRESEGEGFVAEFRDALIPDGSVRPLRPCSDRLLPRLPSAPAEARRTSWRPPFRRSRVTLGIKEGASDFLADL